MARVESIERDESTSIRMEESLERMRKVLEYEDRDRSSLHAVPVQTNELKRRCAIANRRGTMDQNFLAKALSLPIEDRAELAEQLWRSLEGVELEPPWNDEIEARIERIERGEGTSLDWREAMERLRKRLKEIGSL